MFFRTLGEIQKMGRCSVSRSDHLLQLVSVEMSTAVAVQCDFEAPGGDDSNSQCTRDSVFPVDSH